MIAARRERPFVVNMTPRSRQRFRTGRMRRIFHLKCCEAYRKALSCFADFTLVNHVPRGPRAWRGRLSACEISRACCSAESWTEAASVHGFTATASGRMLAAECRSCNWIYTDDKATVLANHRVGYRI